MKRMIDINKTDEQQAIVDGFAEYFVRHTRRDPLLALIYMMIQLQWFTEKLFIPATAVMAILVLFTGIAPLFLPYWGALLVATAVLSIAQNMLYKCCFRLIYSYTGPFSVEEYFEQWHRLNENLKHRIDHFNRTGHAAPQNKPAEVYKAYRNWCLATGRVKQRCAALALVVPAALALGGWFVILPAGVLMLFINAPFFQYVYWVAMAVTCFAYLLFMVSIHAMRYQMQRHQGV